ncbi:MAG: YihY/virulence factor BrkB family protein [Treponema succinifaciens]|nr:MAG: YihY/virulence factor BrkB family protein [Treponema succinifaciens]
MTFCKKQLKKISLFSIVQSLYLSSSLFFSNDLISSASACAFGFLLSVVPISMIICVVLLRVLHASPETVSALISSSPFSSQIISIEDSLPKSLKLVTNFEVVIIAAVVWMSRRFFSSVIVGLKRIFGKDANSRPVKNMFLVFIGEALFVILFSLIIFIAISLKTIVLVPRFYGILEPLNHIADLISKTAAGFVPFIILFAATAFTYKFGSRTNPSWGISVLSSAGTCASYWILTKAFHLFVNINRYNLVYGVLSNIIVMLMGVFFFFIIFFFFAQWLYVYQFFETLLLCELYLLPEKQDGKFFSNIKRFLFINPYFLLKKDSHALNFNDGNFVYRKNSKSEFCFYIASGSILLIHKKMKGRFLNQGTFFGEGECLLKKHRQEDAVSIGKSKVIKIPYSVFQKLIEKNPKIGVKALSQIRKYYKGTF